MKQCHMYYTHVKMSTSEVEDDFLAQFLEAQLSDKVISPFLLYIISIIMIFIYVFKYVCMFVYILKLMKLLLDMIVIAKKI